MREREAYVIEGEDKKKKKIFQALNQVEQGQNIGLFLLSYESILSF